VIDAQHEGLDYVELRFSPLFMAEAHLLDAHGVVEAVVAGVAEAVTVSKMSANLIGILSRTYGPEAAQRELEALLSQSDHLVAIDTPAASSVMAG